MTIAIFNAGGTISGAGETPTSETYQSGVVSIQALMESARVDGLAGFKTDELYLGDSIHMTFGQMLTSSRKIQDEMNKPEISAAVVLCGTDCHDEFSTVVDMTVTTEKAVVFTSAIRPATAMSPDGPRNLHDAVLVARSPESKNRGPLVVSCGKILLAYLAYKINANHLEAFEASNGGRIGEMIWDELSISPSITRPPRYEGLGIETIPREFREPRVHVEYAYTGMRPLKDLEGIDAVVMVAFGAGYLPENDVLSNAEIPIIICTRLLGGYVKENPPCGFGIGAGYNNPQKAAMVVKLALIQGLDKRSIAEALGHMKPEARR